MEWLIFIFNKDYVKANWYDIFYFFDSSTSSGSLINTPKTCSDCGSGFAEIVEYDDAIMHKSQLNIF
jgi:hypothetical protein